MKKICKEVNSLKFLCEKNWGVEFPDAVIGFLPVCRYDHVKFNNRLG